MDSTGDRAELAWPAFAETELVERLTMNQPAFFELWRNLREQLPPREFNDEVFENGTGYPWARPKGSYVLAEGEGELLSGMDPETQHQMIDRFSSPGSGRSPVLAIGANASPDGLWIKFGHFRDAEDRTLLALTGHLHDFDIAATAELALYGALAATLVPSSGTAVEAATLWVTDNQLTQLTWAEIPYWLGRIRTRFSVEASLGEYGIADADKVLAFVARFGAFCPEGAPLALAAIPAVNRQTEAMTQVELLDLVSTMTFGEGHTAESLLKGLFENPAETQPPVSEMLHAHATHFESEHWTPFGTEAQREAAPSE